MLYEQPNKQLQRTDAGIGAMSRFPRRRAAAELRRYAHSSERDHMFETSLRARRGTLIGACFALVVASGPTELGAQVNVVPPVRQMDHIMIRSEEPGSLYRLFVETFELPVAWEMATRGGVISGGVGFGNVNVETIRFPGQTTKQSLLVGFALEPHPSLSASLAELDRRHIPYGAPRPFVIRNSQGIPTTLWTNVTLGRFSDSDSPVDARMHIFLSEYSPAYVDVNQRRKRLHDALLSDQGGALGVQSVLEVRIGATDLPESIKLWKELLSPYEAGADGFLPVGSGPAVRLVRAARNEMQGFVVAVASLRKAEVFLRDRMLLGTVSDDEVTIDSSKVEGLQIRLAEKK
jgi:hypothetical protein